MTKPAGIILGPHAHDLGWHCLPLDVATESIAIISRKGAGKTHTARCAAEDLITGHVQTLVIDPLDVWWGLRVAADGKGDGLDIVIFGGSHADLPLLETSGDALADLIVDKGINAVLVLDALTQGSQYRFMTDFATRLYERKGEQANRTPLHIIVDEADSYVAQKPFPEAMRCLGAMDRIVRRGRSRGLGTTLITQRPAVISKDVLTQTEILISLQVTAPQDRKALQDWINANATKDEAKQYLESLASMQRGEAWVWSPAKLKCFYRVKIRQTRTFDSSFTPAVGKTRVSPKLRDLDLTAIRAGLESVIQEAAENDPAVLKAKIKALEKQIAKSGVIDLTTKGVTMDEALEMTRFYREQSLRQGINQRDAQWHAHLDDTALRFAADLRMYKPEMLDLSTWVKGYVHRHGGMIDCEEPHIAKAMNAHDDKVDRRREQREAREKKADDSDFRPMSKAERCILVALAQHEDGLAQNALALIAGYSAKGGGFQNALSMLRGKEYITRDRVGGDGEHITAEGLKAVGPYEKLPVGEELLKYWCGRLPKAEKAILQVLAICPGCLGSKAAVARAAGYAETGGGFLNALSALRTRGLIFGSSPLHLADQLR